MNDFERRLDAAFPAEPLSDALCERVARLRPGRPSPLRPLLLVGAALGVVGLAVVLLLPRTASAAPLLAQAQKGFVGHTRTFRLDEKGGRRLESEAWYAPGRSRLETLDPGHLTTVILDQRRKFLVLWDPRNGSLKIDKPRTAVNVLWFPLALDSTTLADSLRQVRRPLPPLEDTTLDGRPVKCADLREGGQGVVLYGEPGTLRLLAFEIAGVLPGRGPFHELTFLEPGLPPAHAFNPVIELNGHRIDVLREHDRIDRELAKGVAHYSVPGGKLVVRRVAMNRHGDLFVLYTRPGDDFYKDFYPTAVTDDAGGTYVKGIGFQPFFPDQGFSYDGKPLAGVWYARLGSGRPKRVTITFRQPFSAGSRAEIRYAQRIAPQPTDILDFQPFMAMGLASPAALEEDRAFALEGYYERKGRWFLMERWAREAVALSDAQFRGTGLHTNYLVHYLLAKALTMQGKRVEALGEIAETRARISPAEDAHPIAMLRALERRLASRP